MYLVVSILIYIFKSLTMKYFEILNLSQSTRYAWAEVTALLNIYFQNYS